METLENSQNRGGFYGSHHYRFGVPLCFEIYSCSLFPSMEQTWNHLPGIPELPHSNFETGHCRRRAWSFFWRTLFRFILAHCYNFWHVRIAETPGFQIFSIRLLQARKAFRSKNARNDQRWSVLLNLMIGRQHAVRLQLHICLGPNSRLGWRYGSKDAILCVWKAGFLALQF